MAPRSMVMAEVGQQVRRGVVMAEARRKSVTASPDLRVWAQRTCPRWWSMIVAVVRHGVHLGDVMSEKQG
jgi:hypothetical protein